MELCVPRNRSIPSSREDIDPQLLKDVQKFLEMQVHRLAPSTPLQQAWDHFYNVYEPLITKLVANSGLNYSDQCDCNQEIWRDLLFRLRQYQYDPDRARFCSWLRVLVRNKIIDVLRRHSRHSVDSLDRSNQVDVMGDEPDPLESHSRSEIQERVRKSLILLSHRVSSLSYQVLHLRWIEGWSVGEVASALKLSPEQVRERDHRMKKVLRGIFEQSTKEHSLASKKILFLRQNSPNNPIHTASK